jgi:hypothetical protein
MRRPTPEWAAEVFAVANLAFLGVDIAFAHAANSFADKMEWAPVFVSVALTVALAPGLASHALRLRLRWVAIACGGVAISTGVAGLIYHLRSGFFQEETLRGLVYAAPFAAPLAYVGIGLLLLLSRIEEPGSDEWSNWVVFLALGGFLGNFVLCLTDHAQNAFFSRWEWVAVGAGAFAVGFLFVVVIEDPPGSLLRICLALLGIEAVVGVIGLMLHWRAIARMSGPDLTYRVIYGAPAFAPLLFADLAVLGAIGLWSRLAKLGGTRGTQDSLTARM